MPPTQAAQPLLVAMHSPHSSLLYNLYTNLQSTIRTGEVEIDGDSLDISAIVAVSWYAIRSRAQDWTLTSPCMTVTVLRQPSTKAQLVSYYGPNSPTRVILTRPRRQHRLWRQCRYSLESTESPPGSLAPASSLWRPHLGRYWQAIE